MTRKCNSLIRANVQIRNASEDDPKYKMMQVQRIISGCLIVADYRVNVQKQFTGKGNWWLTLAQSWIRRIHENIKVLAKTNDIRFEKSVHENWCLWFVRNRARRFYPSKLRVDEWSWQTDGLCWFRNEFVAFMKASTFHSGRVNLAKK